MEAVLGFGYEFVSQKEISKFISNYSFEKLTTGAGESDWAVVRWKWR